MKRLIPILTFTALFLTIPIVSNVSAHVLKSDKGVGAVVHIDPDDDPIVSEPASFFFEVKSTNPVFSLQNCDCVVTISSRNKELFSTFLTSENETPSLTAASFTYTFPEKGIYTISLKGKPIGDADFEQFELNYDFRVDRTSSSTINRPVSGHLLHYVGIGAIVLIFLGVFLFGTRKNKNTQPLKVVALLLLTAASLLVFHTFCLEGPTNTQDQAERPCCLQIVANNNPGFKIEQPEFKDTFVLPVGKQLQNNLLAKSSSRSPPSPLV